MRATAVLILFLMLVSCSQIMWRPLMTSPTRLRVISAQDRAPIENAIVVIRGLELITDFRGEVFVFKEISNSDRIDIDADGYFPYRGRINGQREFILSPKYARSRD